jgi:hypothetical protein
MAAVCLADTLLAANGSQWQKLADRGLSIVAAAQYAIYDGVVGPTSLTTFYENYKAFQKLFWRDAQIAKNQLIYVAVGSADTVDTILSDGVEFERMSYRELREAELELLSEINAVTDLPTLMGYGKVFQRYSDLDILRLQCAFLADADILSDVNQILIDGKQFQECSDRELIVVQDQLLCELANGGGGGVEFVTEGGGATMTTEGGGATFITE